MRAAIAGFACCLALAASGARAAEVGPITLETLEGATLLVEAPARGARVLHFWATWCPSCQGELAELGRAASACAGSEVEVLAVDVGESVAEIRSFLAANPASLRVVRDPKGEAWRRSGGREMPANLIWTPAERRWTFGPSSEDAWRERLAALGCAARGVEP
jgi:thiol-disulfide isomerase/thioredoxin